MSEKLEYSSRRVGVRPDRLRALRGPVLTIIVKPPAKDKKDKDNFVDLAEVYWTPRSDRLVRKSQELIGLEEVIDIIDQNIGFDVTWQQVNVVTHGGLGGLFMPLRRNGSIQELTSFDVDSLRAPRPRQIDPNFSYVVVRGCTIGRDKALLQALSRKFAGVSVYAPKTHILAYRGGDRGLGVRELLYRRFWAFRPGANRNIRPSEMAHILEEQRETMPIQPTRAFDTIVSKSFDPHSKEIQLFFRKGIDVQDYAWDFPDKDQDDVVLAADEIGLNPDLLTGKAAFQAHLIAADSMTLRAELTQPDHVPLENNHPLWKDLDAWARHGHWKLDGKNLKNVVIDPKSHNPRHKVRGRVSLSRVVVEACELEGDITDLDVRELSEFGSS